MKLSMNWIIVFADLKRAIVAGAQVHAADLEMRQSGEVPRIQELVEAELLRIVGLIALGVILRIRQKTEAGLVDAGRAEVVDPTDAQVLAAQFGVLVADQRILNIRRQRTVTDDGVRTGGVTADEGVLDRVGVVHSRVHLVDGLAAGGVRKSSCWWAAAPDPTR